MTKGDSQTALHDVLLTEQFEGRIRALAQAMKLQRSDAIRVLVQADLGVMDEAD